MNIHHYNSLAFGGAFTGAARLHQGLLEQGHDSHILYFYGNPPLNIPHVHNYNILKGRRACKTERPPAPTVTTLPDCEIFAYPYRPEYFTPVIMNDPELSTPDIIHLHWISLNLDVVSLIASIPDNMPFIWTMHDMNPLTAGCHYSFDCSKYKVACSQCPQLVPGQDPDPCRMAFDIWIELLKNKTFHVVANSEWLCKEAQESIILKHASSISTIHYGLDVSVFRPINRKTARTILGLDPDETIVCFGADRITNPRKGIAELAAALNALPDRLSNVCLLTFGKSNGIGDLGIKSRHLGSIASLEQQALIYSASDVFVIPSLQEAFGQTALEAMACGIPVVGFRTGGIPDMIEHGKTGLLALCGDAADLSQCIAHLISHPEIRKEIGSNCRVLVEKKFSLAVQAKNYTTLYNSATEINQIALYSGRVSHKEAI